MGRTVVRRVEQPRAHRARDWLLLVVAAIILIFAAVGVVSAAGYLGGKVATTPVKNHTHHGPSTSNAAALRDVARAQAQATAIIKAAQTAGKSIVNSESKKAHHQASAIIAKANVRARSSVAAAVPVVTSAPAISSQATTPSPPASNTGSSSTSSTGASGTSGYNDGSSTSTGSTGGTTSSATAATGANTAGTAPTASAPNLGAVPATWLVVAYNATFGHGPGNAGSIAVINRSKFAFSGVAEVNYIGSRGVIGSAAAPFSGLGPGQSEVLPLNGMRYPSGAIRYQIEVTNVH